MITTAFICLIIGLIVAPVSFYRHGKQIGRLEAQKANQLALASAEHECVWDNWGESYKDKFIQGWRLVYEEYQDRTCLGCGVKQVRKVELESTYY